MTDVIVIGAGVTGCAIARELSRFELRVQVLERASDVCEGTSKANSGIAHAGFDAVPGSRKAQLNVEGSRIMESLSRELDFPYRRNGSLVLCFREEDRPALQKLYEQGIQNGVEGLQILEGEQVRQLEPNVSGQAVAALYAPSGGIVCPFGLTIALAENAAENGVEFHLNTEVQNVEKLGEGYRLTTNRGIFETKVVVNAAGVYADRFHNMVSGEKIRIIPRKGEYCLMDKKAGGYVSRTLFQLPTIYGKGVLVTPTVHGNLLAGPTAVDVEDAEAVNTTKEGLEDVLKRAALSVRALPSRQVITSFAGLRAHEENGDFILGQPKDAPGFFDAAGIESPGLTCAPAIGRYLAGANVFVRGEEGRLQGREEGDSLHGDRFGGAAPEADRGEPSLCQCGMPMRAGDGGRDCGRYPQTSGGHHPGRHQTTYQSRNGQVPGGILFPQNGGNFGQRAGEGYQ